MENPSRSRWSSFLFERLWNRGFETSSIRGEHEACKYQAASQILETTERAVWMIPTPMSSVVRSEGPWEDDCDISRVPNGDSKRGLLESGGTRTTKATGDKFRQIPSNREGWLTTAETRRSSNPEVARIGLSPALSSRNSIWQSQ